MFSDEIIENVTNKMSSIKSIKKEVPDNKRLINQKEIIPRI
jgi:hypothetical protein